MKNLRLIKIEKENKEIYQFLLREQYEDREEMRKDEEDDDSCLAYMIERESDKAVVGMGQIRPALNDYLYAYGGQIGYFIREEYRGHDYAGTVLDLLLCECKIMQMKKVLITTYKTNVRSIKTIMRCGGVLENEVSENGQVILRYWINLEKR